MRPTDKQLEKWLGQWKGGRSKNAIEREELDRPEPHGKLITALWREQLGVETERVHPLVLEVNRLRALLEQNGIDPDGRA